MTNPKDIIGETKPDLSLIPPVALVHAARAMMGGARKYGRYNWREHSVQAHVYVAACKRHLLAWYNGEQSASDSGEHHLGHALACLAILLDAEHNGCLNDDRPRGKPIGELLESIEGHKWCSLGNRDPQLCPGDCQRCHHDHPGGCRFGEDD